MAESAVKSAADLLGKLLVEEAKYLWGVEDKMEELRNELLWMQSFLRDADSIQYDDEIVRMWVFQIKEYVSEAEDIIDNFVIRVVSRRRRTGWMNKLKRYTCFLVELVALHQVASGIDSLKTKISMLSPKLQNYGLKTSYGMKTYRKREAQTRQVQHSLSYRHLENNKIVGLENNARGIMDALIDSDSERRVVSIYSIPGLGKTTLATQVYNRAEIKQHFCGGCAWAYISKQFHVRSVLQVLLADLTNNSTEMFSTKNDKVLISKIQEFLENNKCLVVLDDVWDKSAWDALKAAFTSCGQSGSKVLLTTRKKEVAEYADRRALPRPDPLNENESWELLQHTIGWHKSEGDRHGGSQNKFAQNNKVSQMVKLGKEMVDRCNGLPLYIIVLGGILRNKETLDEWRSVHKNINSYLRRGYDHGRSCMEVLVQSYNDLPYHLKPCFLHLGNFPADYEIDTEKLYWMWMAEGLVTWSHDRTAGVESLEDVANDYLSELAQAGLVIIKKKRSDGRIKSIRMHDLMRDLCLQKAKEENFLNIIDHQHGPDKSRSIASFSAHKRLLRMAIYLGQGVNNFVPDLLSSKAHRYLRSLLLIAGHGAEQDESRSIVSDSLISKYHSQSCTSIARHGGQQCKYEQWMECICKDFRWLRVLDIEGLSLEGKLTRHIQKLVHLRYLSLRETKVSELPSSIGNLRFLEILDLQVSSTSSFVKIPNTLWKLDQLRHLLLPLTTYDIKKSIKLRLDTLSRLETLKNLEVSTSRFKDLRKLENLRKLTLKGTVWKLASLNHILQSPALVSGSLQSCFLGVDGNVINEDPRILSSYDCIRRLNMVGQISVCAKGIAFPQSLKVLDLEHCGLETDPMEILGGLCHLKDLLLGVNCFTGKEMSCKPESFPSLTKLCLRGLVNLELWTVEKGSMPKLNVLSILNCGKLKSIPNVLPSSVYVTCSPCVNGIENYGTCICYSFAQEEAIIGREKETDILADKLLHDENSTIVLWGTPGMGKTSLAVTLYNHPDIKRHFDARAWTCVRSTGCNRTSLPRHSLHGLLRELAPEKTEELDLFQRSCNDLFEEIKGVMKRKKCLVILTHLSGELDVANLELIFGCECLEKGSKLLLTCEKVPQTDFNEQYMHNTVDLSWNNYHTLFEQETKSILHGYDAPTKVKLGKQMVRHCRGHLLSIRMLAGLMATNETLLEWENISNGLILLTPRNDDQPLRKIFLLCFEDLPFHLRNCLLYLANFPRDIEISTQKLYQMWIAAGFVRLEDEKAQTDEILEKIAESCLCELVQRGMVMVWKRGPTGRIKTCRLQFALYDLCLEKAREEDFLRIIDHSKPSASTSNVKFTVNHLAIHVNQDENIIPAPTSDKQLTSLLYFPNISDPEHNEGEWDWFMTICDHFRFLLVLDLQGMGKTEGRLPKRVGKLRHLRYLSLKGTRVSELPSSIEKLTKLQSLDLRVLESLIIPDVLWKFKYLRHLYLPDIIAKQTGKLQLHGLDHLQTLANMHTDKVHLDHVPQLKLLRKISIRNIHAVNELDDILKSLSTSLDLSINSEIINNNPTILSSFQNLDTVKIKGKISDSVRLQPLMFPAHLKELTLKHTKLEQDPIPELEKLLHLRRLSFDHESFLGKKMTFSGDFRCHHLRFRSLSNLEELNNPNRDMQVLQSLVITSCWRLQKDKAKLQSNEILLR